MHDTCECLPVGLEPGQHQVLDDSTSIKKRSSHAAVPMPGTTTVSLIAQKNVIMEKAWWAFKVLIICSAATLVHPDRSIQHPKDRHSLASRV